ncbi:hypothetical protein Bbelb_041230 [Branchiostoma belcheri]|nr:hypothetical protein Bbelb_041230 [Branchiostoma belcheri]
MTLSIEDYCLDLTREDWTRYADLETQEQNDNNNIHRLDETADFEVEDRVKTLYRCKPGDRTEWKEEPDFYWQSCVKEDGEVTSTAGTEGEECRRDCVEKMSTALTEGEHRDCDRKTSTAGTEGEESHRDCVEKMSTASTEGEHRDCGRKTSTAGTEGEECRRDCVEKISTEDCGRKMCKYVS